MIVKYFEKCFWLFEKYCVHPEIISDPTKRAYNRLLIFMCVGIGGTRIFMLLVMWGLTSDERYAFNALQLHLLTYCAAILKFYPNIYRSVCWLLILGHLRYLYAFCVVETPLISEALSTLCIPIVSYFLGGRKVAFYSVIFVASTLSLFLFQNETFMLSRGFEPYYFDIISMVWAIVGAGFVAGAYQHQRAKYHSRLLTQLEEKNDLLKQMQKLTQMKKHFIAVSSHEIRNPLSVVLGRLELQPSKEPLLGNLEDSLYKTQETLDAVMLDIKQAIRLDSMTLLNDEHTLLSLIDVFKKYINTRKISFLIVGESRSRIKIPGHMLAYVGCRILALNTIYDEGGVIEISHDNSQEQSTVIFSYSNKMNSPTDLQLKTIQKDINVSEQRLRVFFIGSTKQVGVSWMKEEGVSGINQMGNLKAE